MLQNNPQIILKTRRHEYHVCLNQDEVQVTATRIPNTSLLRLISRIVPTGRQNTGHDLLSLRAARIQRIIRNQYEKISADPVQACPSPARKNADAVEVPISYLGKDKDGVPGFQQSEQFSQFKQEYTTAVRSLSHFVEDQNAFNQFLERVFPPSGEGLEEDSYQRHAIHQFYLLKNLFEEMLKIMQDAKACLAQKTTPEENQQRQESFAFKTNVLNGLLEALQKCSDGLLIQASDVLLKLRADDLNTLYSQVENHTRGLIEKIISRHITQYYSNDHWDVNQSVHIAGTYRKKLGLPSIDEDTYSKNIPSEQIIQAKDALNDALQICYVLSELGLVTQYLRSLPDFSSPDDRAKLKAVLEDKAPGETLIQMRYQRVQESRNIAEKQPFYKIDATSSTSIPEDFSIDTLYLVDDSGLIIGQHPDAELRLEVAMVKAILEKLTRLHAQGAWTPPLNWEKVTITCTGTGALWRARDLAWYESPDGEVFQPGVQNLPGCFNDISEKQRFVILDRAVQQGTTSLSKLNWQDKAVVHEASDGITLWYVGNLWNKPLDGYCWRESPEGRVSLLEMTDLRNFPNEISTRQRYSILKRAKKEDAPLLRELEPQYLPEDSNAVAEFLAKMADNGLDIDYAREHADWFKKYLADFAYNPLAASLLRLKAEALAGLAFWMLDCMNSKQTDRLIELLIPVWFPDDSRQVEVMKLITLPEKIQNKIAARLVRSLKTTGRQQFLSLSLENVLKLSPQILQRGDMAGVLTDYFRVYAATGADISTASLLQLPEYPDALLFTLLREMPPHKIFTAETGETLWAAFLQKKLRVHQDIQTYLSAHPNYLRELGLDGIVQLPQTIRSIITPQISTYLKHNIPAAGAALQRVIASEIASIPSRNGHDLRHEQDSPTLRALQLLTEDTWFPLFQNIAPDTFSPLFKTRIDSVEWDQYFVSILDEKDKSRESAIKKYMHAYLTAHPHYLSELRLEGITALPWKIRTTIRPQIATYVTANISAVGASLSSIIDSEITSIQSPHAYDLMRSEDSPTLNALELLTPETWLDVLQDIPPDKFFPFANVVIGIRRWNKRFLQALKKVDNSDADVIKKYVDAYLATHTDSPHELGKNSITEASEYLQRRLR